ncbi:MAG: tyrosine-type recombinase/integrase [Solirubrobacteraceae bacterium]
MADTLAPPEALRLIQTAPPAPGPGRHFRFIAIGSPSPCGGPANDLRHTFGTRMAAQGMPMRVLQELMGHRDFKTTLIYADYAPSDPEAEWVEDAFRPAAPDAIDSRARA